MELSLFGAKVRGNESSCYLATTLTSPGPAVDIALLA